MSGETKPKHYTNMKKKVYITLFDQATCKRKLGLPFNSEKHVSGWVMDRRSLNY